jgi:pyruvate-ferredoxin/flavodoxin oxidoreductase
VPVWSRKPAFSASCATYVCPHRLVRRTVMTDAELAAAPEGTKSVPMTGMLGCISL